MTRTGRLTDFATSEPRALRCGVWIPACLLVAAGAGCDGLRGMGGDRLGSGQDAEQRWTICCLRSNAPEHVGLCNALAEMLRQTSGIHASDVRVENGPASSTVYYGEYAKTRSSWTGELELPAKMQKDLSLIRSLAAGNQTPFALAVPEPIGGGAVARGEARHPWDVRNIAGVDRLTLLIAEFYDTETFHERKEAAEQYVQLLRDEGYEAYLLHEPVKSYVSVGSFDRSQLVQRPDGQWWYGTQVEELINRRPEEFQYLTENGYRRRYYAPDGRPMLAPSQLVPVPGGSSGLWGY